MKAKVKGSWLADQHRDAAWQMQQIPPWLSSSASDLGNEFFAEGALAILEQEGGLTARELYDRYLERFEDIGLTPGQLHHLIYSGAVKLVPADNSEEEGE